MPHTPPVPAITLRLLVLRTKNLERLRAFFSLLGVSFVPERHGDGPLHYSGQVGTVVLELYQVAADAPEGRDRLGFAVADLVECVRGLEEAGVPVVTRPEPTLWGQRAVVRDPDGRAIELFAA